jgi:hypothetical protein
VTLTTVVCAAPPPPPTLQAAFPLTQVVSRDPKGVFVLLNLLDLLSARIWDDSDNCEPGLAAIDSLCLQFCLSDNQLMHNAMHALSGAGSGKGRTLRLLR